MSREDVSNHVQKLVSMPFIQIVIGLIAQFILIGVYIGEFKSTVAEVKNRSDQMQAQIDKLQDANLARDNAIQAVLKAHTETMNIMTQRQVASDTKLDFIFQGLVVNINQQAQQQSLRPRGR